MSTTPPIQYSGPKIDPDIPWSIRQHIQLLYQKLGNHTQAFALQQSDITKLKIGSTTNNISETINTSGGGGGGGGSTVAGIPVNNQSGQTSYVTVQGDNGALLVFSDASAIAVSLTVQTPPWGFYAANIGAPGAGIVTFTLASGTISYAGNPGAASMPLPAGELAIIAFDGNNFWAVTSPVPPQTFSVISHQFLNAYSAATGAFTAAQPGFGDISGVATTAQIGTGTPAAGKYVDGAAGAWTALPTSSGVSSLDGITGAVTLVAGANVTITDNSPSAGDITIAATAGSTPACTQNAGLAGSRSLYGTSNPDTTPPVSPDIYQNTNSGPMFVACSYDLGGGGCHGVAYCDSSSSPTTQVAQAGRVNAGSSAPNYYPAEISFWVPSGYYYGISVTNGSGSPFIRTWTEWVLS